MTPGGTSRVERTPATRTGMKPPRIVRLNPPRTPLDLPAGAIASLEDGGEYTAMAVTGCNLGKQAAAGVVFDQVVLRRVSMGGTRLPDMRMSDALLEASDLSGVQALKARWYRDEFVGCRLTGMQLFTFHGVDIFFRECSMENAMFTAGRFKSVRFERCNLRGMLMEKMDLAGTVFRNCDMAGADLSGSGLKGVDFRGSDLSGLRVEGRQLRGTLIDSLQAVQIASLLGIIVQDPPD
jgi:uncharacterized protein YjbI with pentapeptide repeats